MTAVERSGAWAGVPASVAERLLRQTQGTHRPHAWLFLGPRSGGARAAGALAQALCCPVQKGVGCGICRVCLRIGKGTYPDVHVIAPEGNFILVETVRDEVIAEAARSPFEGNEKVFVIEDAERMNPSSQNALLKTLEEPAANTYLILVCEDDEDLLDTVASRCSVLRIDPLSPPQMIELLVDQGVAAEDALFAVRAAGGDLEKARRLAIESAARGRRRDWLGIPDRVRTVADALDVAEELQGHIKEAVAERGSAQSAAIAETIEAFGERRGTAAVRNALAARLKRELRRVETELIAEAFDTLGSFYRDVLLLRAGARDVVRNIDSLEALERWAAGPAPAASLTATALAFLEAQADLEKNANATLVIEAALLSASKVANAG